MAVGAESGTVEPRLGNRIDDLFAGAAEHGGGDGGGGDADEENVVQADAVEGIFKGEDTLDFVGLHHGGEDVVQGDGRPAFAEATAWWQWRGEGCYGSSCRRVSAQPVGHCQNRAEVVGGMAPFGGEPGVVEVQPPDDGSDVERGLHGIEFVGGAGDACAVGDGGAGDDRAEELGAGRISEGHDAAGERVGEAPAGGVEGLVAGDAGVQRVIGEIGEEFVRSGTDVGDGCGHGESSE